VPPERHWNLLLHLLLCRRAPSLSRLVESSTYEVRGQAAGAPTNL